MNTPSVTSKALCAATLLTFPSDAVWSDNNSFLRMPSTPIYTFQDTQKVTEQTLPCSILNNRKNILDAIESLANEYSEANWDGNGANPVSQSSLKAAKRFVEILSATIEEPDVGVDADGFVYLEWYHDSKNQCLVSFSDDAQHAFCNLVVNNLRHDETYRIDEATELYQKILKVAHV